MLDKHGIYKISDILKFNADYNLILSGKSIAKTSKTLEYILRECSKSGFIDQFAYIRRWSTDVTAALASTYFANVKKYNDLSSITGFPEISYEKGAFYNANVVDGKAVPQGSPIGYVFTLSATEHISSTAFPNIRYIIFDEFIAVRKNLPNEFNTFMVLVSNLVRLRKDVKIFMLGNLHSRNDLYFREMGLKKIKTQKAGTIDFYTYKNSELFDGELSIAVEICGESVAKRKSNKYFAFDSEKSSTVSSSKWTMELYPHLPRALKFKPIDVVARMIFQTHDTTYEGELVAKDGLIFVNVFPRTTEFDPTSSDYLVYAKNPPPTIYGRTSLDDVRTRLDEAVLTAYRRGAFYFSDNETGDDVTHFIEELLLN